MLVIGLLIAWVLLTTGLLLIWARLHIEAREAAGIDEQAYVNEGDERSLSEAA